MARFFFHVEDSAYLPDEEGTELEDLDAARAMAVSASGEALRDAGAKFWRSGTPWRMFVTDAAGELQFTLTFSAEDAVPSGSEPPSSD